MTSEERKRLRDLEEENARLKDQLQQRDEAMRRTMASYLTDEVLEEVLEKGESVRIGGERRVVTMMFTDIRRSTQLSESMNATAFIEMLNHYLEEMIEIVNAWQGNILSFVGDAIVSVFGAPRPNEDAARDAVACAVAMQRRMPVVNAWNAAHGYPNLSMGVGIHTGEAILGNIGSQTRAKYDMIGRNVNLACLLFKVLDYADSEPGGGTMGPPEGHPDGYPDPSGDRLRQPDDQNGTHGAGRGGSERRWGRKL